MNYFKIQTTLFLPRLNFTFQCWTMTNQKLNTHSLYWQSSSTVTFFPMIFFPSFSISLFFSSLFCLCSGMQQSSKEQELMYAVGIFTKNYFTSRALIFFVTNTLGSGRCVFILSITCFVCDFFLKRVKPRYSASIFLRRKYWGFTCLFFWQITTLDSVSYS